MVKVLLFGERNTKSKLKNFKTTFKTYANCTTLIKVVLLKGSKRFQIHSLVFALILFQFFSFHNFQTHLSILEAEVDLIRNLVVKKVNLNVIKIIRIMTAGVTGVEVDEVAVAAREAEVVVEEAAAVKIAVKIQRMLKTTVITIRVNPQEGFLYLIS